MMKKVPGNDALHRMNYLYQISKSVVKSHPELASYYGNLLINISKKNCMRLHPEVKRQLCKKCKCVLINNVSAKMKIRTKNNSKTIQWVCNTCHHTKSIPADPNKDNSIWLEKPEAVVEIIS